jgi:hypothetical protein
MSLWESTHPVDTCTQTHTENGRNIRASLETADLFTRNNPRHRPATRTIINVNPMRIVASSSIAARCQDLSGKDSG